MAERLRLSVIIVYVLFSLSLAAQGVVIRPSGPTTRTPVEIRYLTDCAPEQHTVTIVGKVIKVHFAGSGWCGDPPITIGYPVLVPRLLEPGDYRVEVTVGETDEIRASGSFTVRNADPNVAFELHPFVVPGHLLDRPKVRLSAVAADEPLCPDNDCRVLVDGVEVTNKKLDNAGNIWFVPPPHAPGLVDVVIRRTSRTPVEVKGALYYFDKSAPANLSIFERVLFPILTSTDGANGSRWRTEAAILNPKRYFVENYNEILPFQCIDYPCGERLNPGEQMEFEGGEYPRGIALLASRNESPALSYALRARDLSREAEDFGTEIPVLREHDLFFNEEMTLLDVPLDPRYRVKLRIYALPEPGATRVYPGAVVTIVRADRSRPWHDVPLTRTCTALTCPQTPYYAELDLPAGAIGERVDVYVEAMREALTWAFITVTNNDTQQVTIVTPDGKGGQR